MKNSGPIVFLTLVIFISLVISPRPIIEGRGKSGGGCNGSSCNNK
jgi:hypothetical protein